MGAVAADVSSPERAATPAATSNRWAALALLRHDLAVASSAPFRASMREPIREAVRHGAALIVGAAILNGAWLIPVHPELWSVMALSNLMAAVVAMIGTVVLARRPRVRPELVIVVMLAAVDLAIALVGGENDALALVAAGYFLLLPPIVALVVPWDTRIHVGWLGAHALVVAIVTELALSPAAVEPRGPVVMLGLLAVASAVSLLGHLGNVRARVQSHVAIEAIERLNRELRRDETRLLALNRRLERLGLTDGLTGLRNRAALQRDLRGVMARIRRHGESYAILMIDLDHFKAINDGLGHFIGDDVLRRVAHAMESAIRVSDNVYRFGGEEFLALVPVASRDEAMALADRVRRGIEDLAIGHPANPPYSRITISIGVALVDRASLDEGFDAWLRAADGALYRAKRDGRNRVAAAWLPAERPAPARGKRPAGPQSSTAAFA